MSNWRLTSGGSILVPGQLPGEPSNAAAAAGNVGEFIQQIVGLTALANGIPLDIGSINLPPGDWDVVGAINFQPAGTTSVLVTYGTISGIVDAITQPFFTLRRPTTLAGNAQYAWCLSPRRALVNVLTAIKLTAYSEFSVAGMQASGVIQARRMR